MKLPKFVVQALRLLKRDLGKTKLCTTSRFGTRSCPIGKVYGVRARSTWVDVSPKHKEKLESKGWTGKLYYSFIRYHDAEFFRGKVSNRKKILSVLGFK